MQARRKKSPLSAQQQHWAFHWSKDGFRLALVIAIFLAPTMTPKRHVNLTANLTLRARWALI
jgi:hypothetical protein